MPYMHVAQTKDAAPGHMIPVTAGGKKLLLANVDGTFFAIQQKCPHFGANLCKGKLDGHVVTCPMHGARFDVKTGQLTSGPKLLLWTLKSKNAASFSVKLERDAVLVSV